MLYNFGLAVLHYIELPTVLTTVQNKLWLQSLSPKKNKKIITEHTE